jgi:Transposase
LLDQAWVGVDVGKDHHWAAAVDADGQVLLSRKIANDQQAILACWSKWRRWPGG